MREHVQRAPGAPNGLIQLGQGRVEITIIEHPPLEGAERRQIGDGFARGWHRLEAAEAPALPYATTPRWLHRNDQWWRHPKPTCRRRIALHSATRRAEDSQTLDLSPQKPSLWRLSYMATPRPVRPPPFPARIAIRATARCTTPA